ncbi:MAG: 2-C-methyl-D-erythritol 4-phosphate cytidylyltransferase [Alphaproteobacteria bacterium]|nr:2-C-methyl-D-erythritol 4-phosphate cytidylyltransferase [Alphaproteobacteria bacterium]
MARDFFLIIVAAGKGTRTGTKVPKQYVMLNNKMLLRHTLDAFADVEGLRHIYLVVNPKDEDNYLKALDGYLLNGLDTNESVTICAGGKTRQQSVHRGLKALGSSKTLKGDDIVLIHDAARPFIVHQDIGALLDIMKVHKGASLAYNITDTCRSVNKLNIAQEEVSRKNLWALQTPQAFHYGVIIKAHDNYDPKKYYTDDTALASEIGCDVALVPASKYNFKITTQEDLHMAERILSTGVQTTIRIGTGYDVHAFDDDAYGIKSIRLCGIDIDYDRKLKGHSDADVAIHALCDAIYGAIAQGDIGTHFPPDNPDYKDMDSAVFLEHAMSLLRSQNGKLVNADVTIICERPKISLSREKMVERVAQIMNVPTSRINIKATTTEQLGFAGRKEGIAAHAVVSVSLPNDDE